MRLKGLTIVREFQHIPKGTWRFRKIDADTCTIAGHDGLVRAQGFDRKGSHVVRRPHRGAYLIKLA